MIVSLIALVLIVGTLGAPTDPIPYTGFRMTVTKDFVLNMYMASIDAAAKKMPEAVWPDVNFTKGVDFFSLGFYVYEIKCIKASYDKTGAFLTVGNKEATVQQSGGGVSLEYSFKWRFQLFGMDLLYGSATGTAKSTTAKYTQKFLNRDLMSNSTLRWAFAYVLDWQNMFGVSKMLDYVLTLYAVPYMNEVLNKPLSSLMLTSLRPWLDIMIPFHEDKSLIVWMMNSFYSLEESPANYVTLGFATNLTGVDRPYNKRLFREVRSVVTAPDKAQVCMASPMTSGILEIQNKGKDFLFRIDPKKDLSLTGTLRDLNEYMPKLAEKFDLNDTLGIGCRPNTGMAIMMINDKNVDTGNTRVQVVVNCDFADITQGVTVLSSTITMRATLKMDYKEDVAAYKITGTLTAPQGYSYAITYQYVPMLYPDSFASILMQIISMTEGFPLLQSGLIVPPPFKPAGFKMAASKEEVCFSYS